MPRKKAKPATETLEGPFATETERKGRGRKQVGASFSQSINSAIRLTSEELFRMKDFYSANAAAEGQFRRISREQGCRC